MTNEANEEILQHKLKESETTTEPTQRNQPYRKTKIKALQNLKTNISNLFTIVSLIMIMSYVSNVQKGIFWFNENLH